MPALDMFALKDRVALVPGGAFGDPSLLTPAQAEAAAKQKNKKTAADIVGGILTGGVTTVFKKLFG